MNIALVIQFNWNLHDHVFYTPSGISLEVFSFPWYELVEIMDMRFNNSGASSLQCQKQVFISEIAKRTTPHWFDTIKSRCFIGPGILADNWHPMIFVASKLDRVTHVTNTFCQKIVFGPVGEQKIKTHQDNQLLTRTS